MSARPKRQGEGALSDAIRDALALDPGLRLWRNSRCAVVKGNRMVRGGLGENGSADLIGVLAVRVEYHDGPRSLGRMIALEVKVPGEIPTAEEIDAIARKLGWNGRAQWQAGLIHLPAYRRGLAALSAADRHMLEQEAFLADVRAVGGFAAYVSSVDEARAAIARARTGAAS